MSLRRVSCLAAALLGTTALTAVPAEAAVTPKVVFKNGRLVVVGTDAGEAIVVSRSGSIVRVKIGSKFYTPKPKPQAKLTKAIVVRASGGDDTVVVDSSGGALPRATIKGGDGNDTLRGSAAGDVVRGGNGNDVLQQSGGDDTLSGEAGDDRYLLDADGADALLRLAEGAGGGTDTVDFSATTTRGLQIGLDATTQLVTPTFGLALSAPGYFEGLTGGTQDDTLRGGPGPNTVLGGPGSDVLSNSQGDDILDGGAGDSFYAIDGDLAGSTGVAEPGGPETDVISLIPTTGFDTQLNTGSTVAQPLSTNQTVRMHHPAAIDRIYGSSQSDTLVGNDLPNWIDGLGGDDDVSGGAGNDSLFASEGEDTVRGDAGDDTYVLDGHATAVNHLVELPAGGTDTLFFGDTGLGGIDVDLSDTGMQAATSSLDVQLNAGNTFENVTGSDQDDTIAGNSLTNVFRGRGGKDTYVHHGAGDGIDNVAEGLNAALGEQVRFESPGPISASDITIDATGTQVRDAGGGTYGFDLAAPAFNGTSFMIFGTTDQATDGQLITFNGAGGFAQGSNVDSLIATYVSNGVTIGGAGGRDRIIDHSPNGNSLVGRDGVDVLVGGDGADTLQGDRGFAPGVSDTYTGGADADTFRFGEAFGGGSLETFGAETVTDFGTGADTIDLFTGLSVRSGLGTTSVVIWDGVTDHGTITATNGHLWIAGDFT